jgi:hypothetical protein
MFNSETGGLQQLCTCTASKSHVLMCAIQMIVLTQQQVILQGQENLYAFQTAAACRAGSMSHNYMRNRLVVWHMGTEGRRGVWELHDCHAEKGFCRSAAYYSLFCYLKSRARSAGWQHAGD